MPRTSLQSVPISVVAALAVAFVACGRTGLDSPFADAGGTGGAGGRFPTGGAGGFATGGAGGFATGGAGGFATGGAGGFATGGAGGFATGGAGGFTTGGAGGGRVRHCVDGANSCADEMTEQVCIDGDYTRFPCPMGCFGGVCTACAPGTSMCATPNATQLCGADGVLEPPEPCAGACQNGVCVVGCAEGATRCASQEGQQTCKGGQWLPAVDCPFVCVDDACGMDPKHVFVTSQVFVGGDLGGLTGADDLCRRLAVSAGLSSSYFAWLSDDTGSPSARFSEDVGPYVLVDGTIVANNWTGLTMGGMLRHPIDLTETGGAPPIGTAGVGCTAPFVWTNTNVDGTRYGAEASCNDWSNPMSPTALFGSTALIVEWSDMCTTTSTGGTPTCAGTAPLYCFEQ